MMTLTQETNQELQAEQEMFTSDQKSRLIVKADVLRAALNRISSALASKVPIPIMEGIYLHAWPDRIRLRAANGNFYAETDIKEADFQLENGFEAAIVYPGKKFVEIANKVTASSITLEFDGLNSLIKSGGLRASMKGDHHAMYPDFPVIVAENSFEMPAGALLHMYKKTSFAVSASDNIPILMGISHEITNKQFRCVSTDKYRFARNYHEVDIEVDDIAQTVPAITIAEISKHLKSATNVTVSFGRNYVAYRTEDVAIYSGVIVGTYPPTDRLVSQQFTSSFQIGVSELKQIINRVSIYADDTGATLAFLQLRPADKQLRFISLQSEFGRLLEDVRPSKAEGENVVISSNVRYLMDALKTYPDGEILKLSFNGFNAFILQQVGDNESNVNLVVPVKNAALPPTAEIREFAIIAADSNPFEERAVSYAESPELDTD